LRLLLLDIETAPNTVYTWGLYDQNIGLNQIISTGYVLCYAAKWYGSKDISFDSIHQSKSASMLKRVHQLLDECDAVIHYNGKKFDIPTLNKEFLVAGMKPPSPYKQIDLYLIARSTFKFASNKLDHVSQILDIGAKAKHEGQDLWTSCMKGDADAWERMQKYNRQDVVLLEGLYDRLLPWIRNHPNHGLYDEPGLPVCPNCGSGHLQRRGFARTAVAKYARLQCQGCGAWCRDSAHELPKEDRANIMRRDMG
jgi:DNA polymerase elongation subunit (family B)